MKRIAFGLALLLALTQVARSDGNGGILHGGTDLTSIGNVNDALKAAVNDGTNTAAVKAASVAPLATDPALVVAQSPNKTASYSASVTDAAAGTLPTDVFTITGSAGKVIRILYIEISGTESTAAIRDVQLIKRSAADTGGTSTTLTNVPHDSNNAAGTATVRAYTVNPTLGTAVGQIRARVLGLPAANLNGSDNANIWDWTTRQSQAPTLRGTGDVLAINFNGTTMTGNLLDFAIEWVEE